MPVLSLPGQQTYFTQAHKATDTENVQAVNSFSVHVCVCVCVCVCVLCVRVCVCVCVCVLCVCVCLSVFVRAQDTKIEEGKRPQLNAICTPQLRVKYLFWPYCFAAET